LWLAFGTKDLAGSTTSKNVKKTCHYKMFRKIIKMAEWKIE